MAAKKITHHWQLEVFTKVFPTSMRLFELSKKFPPDERYSLTDQVRRSSRSVCRQIAEGWRRRRFPSVFCNKISEADGEAGETQTWIQFAVECGYLDKAIGRELFRSYDEIMRTLVGMTGHWQKWTLPNTRIEEKEKE